MTTFNPTAPFITPFNGRTRAMETAYSFDFQAKVIIQRKTNLINHTVHFYAFQDPDNPTDGWEPWEAEPKLGKALGECKVSGNYRQTARDATKGGREGE